MKIFGGLFFFLFCFNSLALTSEQCSKVLAKAREMTTLPIQYDGAYFKIPYPMGDVPADKGVCTDMIVRSLRTIGIDLQQLVHEDMNADFKPYKGLYGKKGTDSNIDHRRVLNLRVYFKNTATDLPLTLEAADYQPCDIVTWNLPKGLKHVGLVSDQKSADGRPFILHHIFQYPSEDDLLFQWDITGHFSL